jgi:hypothetical protein
MMVDDGGGWWWMMDGCVGKGEGCEMGWDEDEVEWW